MLYYSEGSENTVIGPGELEAALFRALDKLGKRKKVLVVPPDFTRFHSRVGEVTTLLYKYYREDLRSCPPLYTSLLSWAGQE